MMRATVPALAVALLVGHGGEPLPNRAVRPALQPAPAARHPNGEAERLLAAARGVSPVICTLAGAPVGNGWGHHGAPLQEGPDAAVVRWALQPTLDPQDRAALAGGLRDDDGCVRVMAARILAGGGSEGGAVLLAALEDPAPHVRRSAAEGLGYAEHRPAVRALLRALEDQDLGVRANAAWALGRMEAREALEPLLALLRHEDPHLRAVVARAVGEMLD